jgi:hypothetical protein
MDSPFPKDPRLGLTFDSALTASELGKLAGRTRVQVHRTLADVEPATTVNLSGNQANAYRVADLPQDLRDTIDPFDFSALQNELSQWKQRYNPSREEVARLLACAFTKIRALEAAGASLPLQKARQIDWLVENAPMLAKTREAMRKMYDRYFDRFISEGYKGLLDKRRKGAQAARSRRAPALPEGDIKIIVDAGVRFTSGRLSANRAWQLCWHELSSETKQRYPLGREIPKRVRKQVLALMELGESYINRPRHFLLNGPSQKLNHTGYYAGDFYSADDFTLEVYFWVPDASAKSGFLLTRGQTLVYIDVRSKRILDFCLIPSGSFRAEDIRKLNTRVCSKYGIPRVGFHFENSQFDTFIVAREAKLPPGCDLGKTFAERVGCRIIRSKPGNPRAKVVENIGGIFQRLMCGEPGYVGKNERGEPFEHVEKAKQLVNSGGIHPSDAGFRSYEEWRKRLEEIFEQYNDLEQHSGIMGGDKPVHMSPNQAWEALQQRNDKGEVCGLTRVTDENRYLLAYDVCSRKVTRNGITVNYRQYVGRETGLRVGQEVLVWYDPDQPESIIITDLQGENMGIVEQKKDTLALVASSDAIREGDKPIREHNRAIKEYFSNIKAAYIPPGRRQIGGTAKGYMMEELRARVASESETPEVRREAAEIAKMKEILGI